MLAVFYFNSLYDFRNWIVWDELKAILKSAALILLVLILYLYSQKFSMSRFILASGILIFVPLCLIARYAFRRIFFSLGILTTNIIILGAGRTGEIFAETINEHPFTACHIVGFLDDDESKQGKLIAGIPVLGRLDEFERIYNEYHIDEAAVAISTASRSLLTHILDMVEFHVKQVHYIPDMYMLTTFSASIRDVDGMPVISASQGLLNPLNRFIKSIIDYIGAIIALIIFSPIMLWAAWRIKREDGGPALFIQDRVGWKVKHFKVYKFRTMYTDADKRTEELFKDPAILADYQKGIKLKHDPRLTKIGAFLRKTSIDELPQIFNVLKGEMSLVGPRPLIQKDVDFAYGDYIAKKIYTVKPGMTGFWQVSGRSDVDTDIRREMNLYYIRNWSLWLDIVILMRTAYAVISKKGAY
jgi:undecaprenyl-phosphate galactose phosphotransferase